MIVHTTSRITAPAEAMEYWYFVKPCLYIYVLIVSVALIGPPPVVIQINANCCNVHTKSSIRRLTKIGLS